MVASSKGQYFQNTPTIRHRRYPILSQSFDEKTVPRSVWKSRLMGRFLSILFLHRSLFHDSSLSAKNSRYSIALLSLFLNPENRSEITRIHVGSFEGASSSTTHDIIGSPRRHPASSTPRAKFNFFGCNRSNLSDTSYYFATKLYTKFFFPFFPHTHTLGCVSFIPVSNPVPIVRDPGKKLPKFRFLSDLSPRKFNRILFRPNGSRAIPAFGS